jgi:hypothetical protein
MQNGEKNVSYLNQVWIEEYEAIPKCGLKSMKPYMKNYNRLSQFKKCLKVGYFTNVKKALF